MDQIRQFLAPAAVLLPLHREQGPLAVQYRLVITEPGLIPVFCQIICLLLYDAGHGVLHFTGRLQYRVLILGLQLSSPSILQFHVLLQGAAVKQGERHRRSQPEGMGPRTKQVAPAQGQKVPGSRPS